MTCKHDVKRIAIDPSLLGDDKDMLEDLVAAAFNDGVRRASEPGKDGQADCRNALAARHEASVLMPPRSLRSLPPEGAARALGAARRAR